MKPRAAALAPLYVPAVLISVGAYLVPALFLLMISLRTESGFLTEPLGLPHALRLINYVQAWKDASMGRYFLNSVFYSVTIPAVVLILSSFAAFPVARGYVRGAALVYVIFLSGLFLPGGLIPLFVESMKLHLYNSRLGYVVLQSGGVLSFFFFAGYVRTIPRELDEAAVVDGCGYFRYVVTVLWPLMRPALATMGLFSAIGTWNNLIGPVVFLQSPALYPLTRGLFMFYGQYSSQWPLLAAAVVIVSSPLVVLFLLLQRYIVSGALAGAIRG